MYVCALTWVVKTSEVCECVCVYECVLCVSFHVPCVVFFHSTCSLPHFYLFTQSLISQIKKKTLVFLFFLYIYFALLLSFFLWVIYFVYWLSSLSIFQSPICKSSRYCTWFWNVTKREQSIKETRTHSNYTLKLQNMKKNSLFPYRMCLHATEIWYVLSNCSTTNSLVSFLVESEIGVRRSAVKSSC